MRTNNCILIAAILFFSASYTFSSEKVLATAILSSSDDPYYKLAEEIAKTEGISIYETISEAISIKPSFLLWVVSPSNLSNKAIVDFGIKIKNHPTNISTGIITGESIEEAKGLYERGKHKSRLKTQVIANMEVSSSNIKPGIIINTDSTKQILPLTKSNLLHSIQSASYFTGHLHGTPKIWAYEDSEKIVRVMPTDIPKLNNSVIIAHSCDNFRLWDKESFVLPLIKKGVKAYAGFPYRPNTGFIYGEFDDLNYAHTWDDFPIGHIVQIQNHASLQGYANFPYFFLLGDPRISFQDTEPYEIEFDKMVDENHRYLKLVKVKNGVVPVRINNAAKYDFVNIPGIGSSGIHDYFFNNRLQMINVNNDKFILLKNNNNDDLTIYLKNKPCLGWRIIDFTIDVLDTGLVFIQNSGATLFFIIGCLILCVLSIPFIRKKRDATVLKPSFLVAFVTIIVSGIYILFRVNNISITESIIMLNPLLIINIFIFATGGAILYFGDKNLFQKTMAFLIAVFPALIGTLITFAGLYVSNNFVYGKLLNAQLYNYKLPLMCFYTLVLEIVVFGLIIKLVERNLQRKKFI